MKVASGTDFSLWLIWGGTLQYLMNFLSEENGRFENFLSPKSTSLASGWQSDLPDLALARARDRAELFRIVRYIENNPVKAGLVKKPADWPWSSAAERVRRGLAEIEVLT